MLAKSVTFAPQLRGTLACARSPRREQAYWGVREVLVPISSTKTKRSGLVDAATIMRQAALKNSSLSFAPTDLFSSPSQALEHPRNRGVAHRNPASSPQELTPLG
jgi:hypothetical protein